MGIQWDCGLDLKTRISYAACACNGPIFLEYVIIAARNIWKQRSSKHFYGVVPSAQFCLANISSDLDLLSSRVKPELKGKISISSDFKK